MGVGTPEVGGLEVGEQRVGRQRGRLGRVRRECFRPSVADRRAIGRRPYRGSLGRRPARFSCPHGLLDAFRVSAITAFWSRTSDLKVRPAGRQPLQTLALLHREPRPTQLAPLFLDDPIELAERSHASGGAART